MSGWDLQSARFAKAREAHMRASWVISSPSHDSCLEVSKFIKKQCDAWAFIVRCDEQKSARKGDVLKRTLMIYQTAYPGDILIFKEAIRRVCQHFQIYRKDVEVSFVDGGSEPVNELRKQYS